jgi:hypothetical protein
MSASTLAMRALISMLWGMVRRVCHAQAPLLVAGCLNFRFTNR